MKDDPLQDLPEAERQLALGLRGRLRAAERLPPATAQRLARARAAALAAGEAGRAPRWQWAAGGLTAAAVLAVALFLQSTPERPAAREGGEATSAEAIEVLIDEADPEMYEDLELYRWLAQDGGHA